MANIKANNNITMGGGFLFSVAIILLISGWAMESSGYDIELGALLFTIGFWIFMIPVTIIVVVIVILLIVAAFS